MDPFNPFPELNPPAAPGDTGVRELVPENGFTTSQQPVGELTPLIPDWFNNGIGYPGASSHPQSATAELPQLVPDWFDNGGPHISIASFQGGEAELALRSPAIPTVGDSGADIATIESPFSIFQAGEPSMAVDEIGANPAPVVIPGERPAETVIEFDPADQRPITPLEIIPLWPGEAGPHATFLRNRGYGRDEASADEDDDKDELAATRSRPFVREDWISGVQRGLNRSHVDVPDDPLAGISERFANQYREQPPTRVRISGRSFNPRGRAPQFRRYPKFRFSSVRCTRCASILENNRCQACGIDFCPTCAEVMEGQECVNERCPNHRAEDRDEETT